PRLPPPLPLFPYTTLFRSVAAVTLALRALGFGPGQFGLIMARNAPEHVIADLGIVHAGGAAISVYNTLAPEQIEYVANHSEASRSEEHTSELQSQSNLVCR